MNKELLERIEKLEKAVENIRTSCPCLFMNQEPEQECPGSLCFKCEQTTCICDLIDPEEPEDLCGGDIDTELLEDEPEEIEDHD